jgi:hypothetical protein
MSNKTTLNRRAIRMKIDIPFEDAVRHILKAGPMPKIAKAPRKRLTKKTGATKG